MFFFDKLVKLVKIQGSFVCSKVLTFKPIFNFEFLFCYNSLIDIFFPYYIDLIQYCPREQDWIRLIDICDGKTRKFRWLWISQFELEIYFLYVIRLEIVGEWVMNRRPFWIKIMHIFPILLGRFCDKKSWKLLSVLCSLWGIYAWENLQCVFSLQTLQCAMFWFSLKLA